MKPTTTDADWIDGILAGGRRQEDSIRQLYEHFFSVIGEGRRRYGRLSPDDLLTAYHSAILSMRRQVIEGAFRGESSLKTYFNRIFFNKCIDILRKNSSVKEDPVAELPFSPQEEPDVLRRMVREDDLQKAVQLLETLGQPCLQILLDSEYWDYSSEEIAQRIGFSNARSVNSKKYSCLQQLRRMIAEAKAS